MTQSVPKTGRGPCALATIYLDLTTADRYRDYATYTQGITAADPELFMAQDLAKWTNQDFAVSIYNMVTHSGFKESGGAGFVVECVKIDEPKSRAYLCIAPTELPDSLRGPALQDYIDGAVELHAVHGDGQGDASHDSRVGADAAAGRQEGKQLPLAHITLNCTPREYEDNGRRFDNALWQAVNARREKEKKAKKERAE